MQVRADNITQKYTEVECEDEWEFNAPNNFVVKNVHTGEIVTEVKFQKGPIKENGINGCSNEDLVAMIQKRIEGFQDSKYRCDENQEGLYHLDMFLKAMRKRTNKREERGVEGTHEI